MNNSKIGNSQDKIFALEAINGDALKIALKVLCSKSLLVAVYTNSRMNNAEIISVAIVFLRGFMLFIYQTIKVSKSCITILTNRFDLIQKSFVIGTVLFPAK